MPEPKEEQEEKMVIDPNVDALFHQFRSRALKAFCLSLQDSNAARLVVSKKYIPDLLTLALSPTQLETFKSISQLETNEDLLLEMLYDYRNKFITDKDSASAKPGANIIYSPFANLPGTKLS